jgi:hypothetical protein
LSRPSDSDAWVRSPEPSAARDDIKADQFTARLTIDVTAELRGHNKGVALRYSLTVAEILRDLLADKFPDNVGGIV